MEFRYLVVWGNRFDGIHSVVVVEGKPCQTLSDFLLAAGMYGAVFANVRGCYIAGMIYTLHGFLLCLAKITAVGFSRVVIGVGGNLDAIKGRFRNAEIFAHHLYV